MTFPIYCKIHAPGRVFSLHVTLCLLFYATTWARFSGKERFWQKPTAPQSHVNQQVDYGARLDGKQWQGARALSTFRSWDHTENCILATSFITGIRRAQTGFYLHSAALRKEYVIGANTGGIIIKN